MGLASALSHPAFLFLPIPSAPHTLNSYPEALLNFTSRAVGQASVQPSITHLGMEQGEQLPLAPARPPPNPGFPLTQLRAQDSDSGLLPATRPLPPAHSPSLGLSFPFTASPLFQG